MKYLDLDGLTRYDGKIKNVINNYVPSSIKNINNLNQNLKIATCTQSEYDALTTIDPNTIYIIEDEIIFPIGYVYISTNSTSPAQLFGGTWTRIQGKFLLSNTDGTYQSDLTGLGYTQSYNSSTQKYNYYYTDQNGNTKSLLDASITGGEVKHTLTTSEMPSHKHDITQNGNNSGRYIYVGSSRGNWVASRLYVESPGTHYSGSDYQDYLVDFLSQMVNNTGGGNAHNNMPPHLTVFMWQRTA